MLDSVSNFVSAVQSNLRAGTVHNCTFYVPFRTDVFNFLFNGKGNVVNGKRGKTCSEADFDVQHFPLNWYIHYDRLGIGCNVVFPIQIHSYVKFAPISHLKTKSTNHLTCTCLLTSLKLCQ